MKYFILKLHLLFSVLLIISLSSRAQNNIKLLDLTSNSYSSGSSIHVPIGSQMQVTTDYTFEAWLYVDTKPSGASGYFPQIMDRRTVFSFYLIDDSAGTSGKYCLRFVARDNSDLIIASLRSDGKNGSTSILMNVQDWYHVAVSRDGTSTRLFVNGTVADQTTDLNFVLSTPSGNEVNIGARFWGAYERFIDGALDEVRYSDIGRYTSNFTITTSSPPHPISGDPNTILLFNFDSSNVANSTSANSYFANIHGTLSYADWDGFPSDKLPLPVSYMNGLNARLLENKKVELTWATASEKHNRGFELQRSVDGLNWDSIAFIDGAGNSNVIRTYNILDNSPLPNNYYRLKQIDYDGNTSYSEIAYISLTPENNIIIFPNPASNKIQIRGINQSQIKSIKIYDILGNTINGMLLADNNVNITNLHKGLYFIKIEKYDGNSTVRSFIRQ